MNKGFTKKEAKRLGLDEHLTMPPIVKKGKYKQPRRSANLPLFLSLFALFLGIIGLCLFIKLQDFSVTVTFPPVVVAFVVAAVGLSALYVVYKEVK